MLKSKKTNWSSAVSYSETAAYVKASLFHELGNVGCKHEIRLLIGGGTYRPREQPLSIPGVLDDLDLGPTP